MASYNTMPAPAHRPMFNSIPMADPTAPAGTFAPGTKIQVGSQKVIIQKYFSEGGFAHVYLVKMPKPIDGTDIAVLKRVAVPDKEHLANMRTEVETMKKLKGHRPIVTYYDSHASQLKGGGYEVFLLMEFCNGGGLIDFMNTRLQNRLTEPEILKIFSDVTEGVACMHYLKPPLLHRDLKVENVLITSTSRSRRFKLCDFGSTAPPRPAAQTAAECRLIEDDVQKHTTLQYRSPEMIDVYRKLPIDEKSDIWALGVLLYKLCYYTTPFEAQGQLAILNASFKFPNYPPFSDKLKKLIASMLKENPRSRPNVYQVLREACLMQGIEVPIKDIYVGRTASESRRNQQLPSPASTTTSPPVVGAVYSPPLVQTQKTIPDVVPMRRGRPQASPQVQATKPNPSPLRGADPFAALDANPTVGPVDEISSRFPSLDQFSLLHDGGKFDFDQASPTKPTINQRVTEKLADDAFAMPARKSSTAKSVTNVVSKAQKIISNNPELQAVSSPNITQALPTRQQISGYVSQGTMTTPPPETSINFSKSLSQRFQPDHHRSSSLPRNQEAASSRTQFLRPDTESLLLPRNPSPNARPHHTRHASASSRPSLEGGRPSQDVLDPISRTRSSNSRPRPVSTHMESNLDFLRTQELSSRDNSNSSSARVSSSFSRQEKETVVLDVNSSDEERPLDIESNIAFLRSQESEKEKSKKDRRRSSGSNKRKSLPSMSLSGTKTLLAGKFGDAFKRFENNAPSAGGARTPSPLNDMDRDRRELTPIAGSTMTGERSDDGHQDDDDQRLAPEQRRELERSRLIAEEQRVEDAKEEYKQRMADRGSAAPRAIGGVSKAASIQKKVKTLLDEQQSSPIVNKTAEGYGRFTDTPSSSSQSLPSNSGMTRKPVIHQAPLHTRTLPSQTNASNSTSNELGYNKPLPRPANPTPNTALTPHSAPPLATASRTGPRPNAPPKPMHLNSISTGPVRGSSSQAGVGSNGGRLELIERAGRVEMRDGMSVQEKEDYVADFSKRFPSLSGIEMVETDVGAREVGVAGAGTREIRTKEI